MAEKKMCPHCGGTIFMGAITRGCLVEVFTPDKDGEDNVVNISKEIKDKYNIELLKCIKCKHKVTEKDLITGVVCKHCGKPVTPDDLNDEGICSVCVAKKNRAELANASPDELIRMLLEAEKKNSSVNESIAKKIAKADEVTAKTASESKEEDISEKATPADDTAAKPKRRAKSPKNRKKADAVDTSTEPASQTEPKADNDATDKTDKAVDELANAQEAPFPDVPPITEPTAETENTENVQQNNDIPSNNDTDPFQMFDDNEEPF